MHIHATHPREGEGRAHVMQVDVDDITFEIKMHTIHESSKMTRNVHGKFKTK